MAAVSAEGVAMRPQERDEAEEKAGDAEADPPTQATSMALDVNSKEVMLGQMMRAARILERMVNQNNHDDIAQGTER